MSSSGSIIARNISRLQRLAEDLPESVQEHMGRAVVPPGYRPPPDTYTPDWILKEASQLVDELVEAGRADAIPREFAILLLTHTDPSIAVIQKPDRVAKTSAEVTTGVTNDALELFELCRKSWLDEIVEVECWDMGNDRPAGALLTDRQGNQLKLGGVCCGLSLGEGVRGMQSILRQEGFPPHFVDLVASTSGPLRLRIDSSHPLPSRSN